MENSFKTFLGHLEGHKDVLLGNVKHFGTFYPPYYVCMTCECVCVWNSGAWLITDLLDKWFCFLKKILSFNRNVQQSIEKETLFERAYLIKKTALIVETLTPIFPKKQKP